MSNQENERTVPAKTLREAGIASEALAVKKLTQYKLKIQELEGRVKTLDGDVKKLSRNLECLDYKKCEVEKYRDVLEDQLKDLEEKDKCHPVTKFTEAERLQLVRASRILARTVKMCDEAALKKMHDDIKDEKKKTLFQLLDWIGKKPHDLVRYSAILCKLAVKVIGEARTEDKRKMRAKYWGKAAVRHGFLGECALTERVSCFQTY